VCIWRRHAWMVHPNVDNCRVFIISCTLAPTAVLTPLPDNNPTIQFNAKFMLCVENLSAWLDLNVKSAFSTIRLCTNAQVLEIIVIGGFLSKTRNYRHVIASEDNVNRSHSDSPNAQLFRDPTLMSGIIELHNLCTISPSNPHYL
jgi:hypothetical protein